MNPVKELIFKYIFISFGITVTTFFIERSLNYIKEIEQNSINHDLSRSFIIAISLTFLILLIDRIEKKKKNTHNK